MDMKDLLSKMTQLNEAKEASYSPSYRVGKTGDFSDKPHTKRGTPVAGKVGKYGKTSDELGDPDQDPDDDTAASPEKRGRGRPKKAGGAADTKDRYSGAKDLQSVMIGKMPKTLPGKKGAVHKSPQDKEEGAVKKKSLKDWVERVEQVIAENTAMPTSTSTATAPNASQKVMVKPGQPSGQKPPATMTTQTGQTIAVGSADQVKKLGDLVNTGQVQLTKPGTTQPLDEEDMEEGAEKWIKGAIKHPGAFTKKAKSHGMTPSSFASKVLSNKEDYPAKTEKQANLAKTLGKFRKQTDEADIPPNDSLMSPISEAKKKADAAAKKDDKAEKAGKKVTKDIEYDEKVKDGIHGKKRGAEDNKAERAGKKVAKDIEYDMKKKTVKEAAKPDFPDIDNDGNTKESMKKAAADKKKKAVKEGRDHHLKAAYHEGKSHGLSKQPYNCRHDDMEEAKQYHEGYKCGLDECYGQQPILGYVGEESQHDVVDTMASYGAHGLEEDGVEEGAPELLKKEMPLHRHAEKLLAQNGVSIDDPDYHHHLNNTIKHLRQFGNIDLINKSDEQGVAEARVDQLPTNGADYSKYDTDHLKMMLRPGILHRNEAGFKALIRKELKKREQQSQQGVAEGHADQQRKIFKKNGQPVGEVGIDRESSPGVGQWYMKCYAYDIDNSGYDSYEEAVAELKHCLKQGVAEGLDPMKKKRLADLIDAYRDATDPGDYYDREYEDYEDVLELIRAEFGDKIANQVEAGTGKMHFGRHPDSRGDPLGWKKPVDRITKAGKMYKQDSDFLKNTIKSRYRLGGRSATEGVLEDDMEEGNAFTGMLAKTPKGGKFSLGNKSFTDTSDIDEMAFESWDKQLSAILEGKKVDEGMTVSISKGQQGSPDSVSVSAQDGEADQLLNLIKSAGLGLFGGDESKGFAPGDETPSTAPGGIEVVDDHDGMMALMKKLTGGDSSGHDGDYEEEQGHEDHAHADHEEECNECGYMESDCHCDDKEMVDEVESEDQMTYNVAEDNPPDSGAAEEEEEVQDTAQANSAASAFDQSQSNDIDEGAGGPEASEEPVEPIVSESSFFNLYKKLAMLSEESTAEKDEKAEQAGKKVAKDIEYDEGHKGKDDNKAEKAGKKVTKDIEYDDKKDKKLDEWANQIGEGPGKGTDAGFEQDIAFMTKVISGGLNKQKSTGQTTIPVIAHQGQRTGVNENSVADWKKLAGIK